MSLSVSDSSTHPGDLRADMIELDEKNEKKRKKNERYFLTNCSPQYIRTFEHTKTQLYLVVINIIIIFLVIDFSNHNIGTNSTTAVVPLIVVTDDETDSTPSKRFVHYSSRLAKAKNSYSSITPINMDHINFKGRRPRLFLAKTERLFPFNFCRLFQQ